MPLAQSTTVRRRIVEAHQKGQSLKAIAQKENLSYSSVLGYWRRYRQRGLEGLAPDYQHCGRSGPVNDDLMYRAARYLKYLHRQWGAALIRLKLEQRYPKASLPSVRTLQRWFKRAHLTPLRKRLPKPEQTRAQAPHEVWQVDAKEQLTLNDGTAACYLSVSDEHSGAFLEAPVFPPWPNQSSEQGGDS